MGSTFVDIAVTSDARVVIEKDRTTSSFISGMLIFSALAVLAVSPLFPFTLDRTLVQVFAGGMVAWNLSALIRAFAAGLASSSTRPASKRPNRSSDGSVGEMPNLWSAEKPMSPTSCSSD